ncbi:hypothetical protein JTE90_010435 [Oedothorax gibbosus]|uniref:Uncharacterized protein n=1 Tax=Oedothorax gibbosus TaxID=931172 RepID=A0AAV6VZM3_9ARAC|nr:hypothetical protein JTE90_010435 [Oedothorax gibbosus]
MLSPLAAMLCFPFTDGDVSRQVKKKWQDVNIERKARQGRLFPLLSVVSFRQGDGSVLLNEQLFPVFAPGRVPLLVLCLY